MLGSHSGTIRILVRARWRKAASLATLGALGAIAASPAPAHAATGQFQVEEATIADIHTAIKSGQATCKSVVQAYIDRAKAYNGVCTALITPDGASIKPGKGYVRAGKPLVFPTKTVKASVIF